MKPSLCLFISSLVWGTLPSGQSLSLSHRRLGLHRPSSFPRFAEKSAPTSENIAVVVDKSELVKYVVATGSQFGTLAALVTALDAAAVKFRFVYPAPAVFFLFAFLSIRSRVFSFLDCSRPKLSANAGKATPQVISCLFAVLPIAVNRRPSSQETRRPRWTPPGFFFPIIWLSIMVLRATSATLVYNGAGRIVAPATLMLLLHLSVGDTWNTVIPP